MKGNRLKGMGANLDKFANNLILILVEDLSEQLALTHAKVVELARENTDLSLDILEMQAPKKREFLNVRSMSLNVSDTPVVLRTMSPVFAIMSVAERGEPDEVPLHEDDLAWPSWLCECGNRAKVVYRSPARPEEDKFECEHCGDSWTRYEDGRGLGVTPDMRDGGVAVKCGLDPVISPVIGNSEIQLAAQAAGGSLS
jgi:hypothetical protein